MLKELPRTVAFTDIAKDTNLSAQWIGMFFRDEIDAPDIGRVEALYNYLSDTPFEI